MHVASILCLYLHACIIYIVVDRLASMWKSSSTQLLELTIPTDWAVFRDKFNSLQESIAKISVMDELLAGVY